MIAPNFARLKAQLQTSDLAKSNITLFQIINQLIDAMTQFQGVTTEVTNVISGSVGAASELDYITFSDESIDLPNSRQLLAGLGVTFDDSVANQRTINTSGGGAEWDVLTDGDLIEPELIYAGGHVIMGHIP